MDGILDSSIITAEDVTYFHHDNLGSTRLMTNADGEVTIDQDYMPFGGDLPSVNQHEVQNDMNEGYKYTGQREVVSIGLYYYGARYYDPRTGRFITEDTWPGEMANPQSQNLYVYVMNNPMGYVDPTGNVPEDIFPSEEEIAFYEENFSGFEYNISMKIEGFTIENQLQLFLIREALMGQYANEEGKVGFWDRIKTEIFISQVESALLVLNDQSSFAETSNNIIGTYFENIGPFYSDEEIKRGLDNVFMAQVILTVGAFKSYQAMMYNEALYQGVMSGTKQITSKKLAKFASTEHLDSHYKNLNYS